MDVSFQPALPVLAVDDEPDALRTCQTILGAAGIDDIILCQDSRDVERLMDEQDIGVVLLDLSMPHLSGRELLPILTEQHPEVPVIVVTASDELETAVECIRAGACDYMVKPVERGRMVSGVRQALELRSLRREYHALWRSTAAEGLTHPEAFASITTQNAKMKAVFMHVEAIAPTSRPVLIVGETGVGKELVARTLHDVSGRTGPFVAVNLAGLDDNMFSDTLFGHVKGAFTGADMARPGLVEKAAGGTLFLDEIGDLSLPSQVKLLRLLQEQEYFPLGTDMPKLSEARVVVATLHNLTELVKGGRFRKDLYYRLNTHSLDIPPLRDRLDDLPLLLDRFLEEAAESLGKPRPTPPPELLTLLGTHHFPGNVRELQSMVFDAVSRHTSRKLSMEVFKTHLAPDTGVSGLDGHAPEDFEPETLFRDWSQLPTLRQATEGLIAEALRRAEGNQSVAAQLLGISRPALNRRLKRGSQ